MTVRAIDATRERIRFKYPVHAEKLRLMALKIAESGMRPQACFGLPIELVMLPQQGGIRLYEERDEKGRLRRTSSLVQAWGASAMEYNTEYLRVNGIKEIDVFLPLERAAA